MVYENVIYTQKTLAERYGISIAGLQQWYPYAGIVKPKIIEKLPEPPISIGIAIPGLVD
jgi:hypothetical protein